jgi:hypothetical protein
MLSKRIQAHLWHPEWFHAYNTIHLYQRDIAKLQCEKADEWLWAEKNVHKEAQGKSWAWQMYSTSWLQ